DAYSQVIFAPTQLVIEQPQVLHRFLEATFLGWHWAIHHPSEAAQLLVEQYVEPDYQDIAYQTQSLEIIANYVEPSDQPIGLLNQDRWQRSARQLAQAGLIQTVPALDKSIDLSLWS
ncbi:MAG: ABC transporter substrate-binding protein, partial [Leptolyngbya sp. SIO3F4]|nr:ABC transporter substrate-binding protein [Leptolyngbya sp. SIO3F4]